MSEFVTLISVDNQEFKVVEDIANESQILRVFFDRNGPFIEAIEREVVLPIQASLLKRAIEYMEYRFNHKNKKTDEEPEFPITDEEALDLLEVSVYLKI